MPLLDAASSLGICATALKKVCRKLGVQKWPYKATKLSRAHTAVQGASGDSTT
eukprot:CAMPEP_0172079830 /NCGR_PEP_ID=MMETSP1043-20130122/18391_1 /TAXON_ID=464988 /ORGANISM="Hemiselmis andersenii, Strain CCMP441" /LENGTH=52 /DNA_ID=CAMNT_0012741057 /DNA_START=24 /DNA_END=179 /DNA_ORIENTATION=+